MPIKSFVTSIIFPRLTITVPPPISKGFNDKLSLGNLSVKRDWGLASEYVVAMWEMLQQDEPDDYIISTGVARSIEEFVAIAFKFFNLDWREYVITELSLYRPSGVPMNHGAPPKLR